MSFTYHRTVVGICRHCKAANFPGCATHRCLLSARLKDHDVKCSAPGCMVSTDGKTATYRCSLCSGVNCFEWHHIVLAEEEADYGATAISVPSLAHGIIRCRICKTASFPGMSSSELCSYSPEKGFSDRTGRHLPLAGWAGSHMHVDHCPCAGSVDCLEILQVQITRDELQYLKTTSVSSERGVWIQPDVLASLPKVPTSPGARYHRMCYGVCPTCQTVYFPGCSSHYCLLSEPNGETETKCPHCAVSSGPTHYGCSVCHTRLSHFVRCTLSEEEADFGYTAFPKDSIESGLKFGMLQCKHCHTLSFPGTRTSKGMRLVELSSPDSYRDADGMMYRKVAWKNHPHIDGCPSSRTGEELMIVPCTMTFDEMKFVKERIVGASVGIWTITGSAPPHPPVPVPVATPPAFPAGSVPPPPISYSAIPPSMPSVPVAMGHAPVTSYAVPPPPVIPGGYYQPVHPSMDPNCND
eukprot:TRINITY_DN8479_c0_g1_i1.p1 TRINITY_DN8479_c0_g1~~TRINITY_DN8479_c0_g1_i1.p1  ORF type:complete len:467 (+),score=69.24 TRINITY_DN8479_c0_g1_i1:94-1494(+)